MKKVLLLAVFVLLCTFTHKMYAAAPVVAPSGQTIYYTTYYTGSGIEIMITYPYYPGNNYWGNYTKPTGNLVIPDSIMFNNSYYPVTRISDNAFSDCSGLTSVTIPNTINQISSTAFSGCHNMSSVVVETGNTTYDSRNNCNAIIHTSTNTLLFGCLNTTIPNSVTSIGENAFSGCTNLTSFTIPNSVTHIGNRAFAECTGLTSVTIPDSVTSIGQVAFDRCIGLTSVIFNAENCTYMEASENFPVFQLCNNLTSLSIGNNVKVIPAHIFSGCFGLTTPNTYW